jgi:hypothetical protein
MLDRDSVLERLNWCHAHQWLRDCELECLSHVLEPRHLFAESLQLEQTLHAHVKAPDADRLPEQLFLQAGATIHYRKEGFIKFQFPEGFNLIFSSIAISQDDLRDGTAAP